jgi:hypothetical protein
VEPRDVANGPEFLRVGDHRQRAGQRPPAECQKEPNRIR